MNCCFNFKKGKVNETEYTRELTNLRAFSLDELRKATDNFNKSSVIGQGGSGSVYRGTIKPDEGRGNPTTVAIKRFNRPQGYEQWLKEVHIHGGVIHRNLVKLLGYCSDGKQGLERILVYRYMPNKSLHDHLLDIHLPALSWKTRLQIMLGAAEGLAYLHEGLEVPIIFRNFKPSKVLLDENFRAKLSGLGVAREGPTGNQSDVSTQLMGTVGYIAPEYVETGRISPRCDIYAYGVVLYQILTGRRPIDPQRSPPERTLLEWVKQFPADNRKLMYMIMDFRLQNQYSRSAAIKVTKLADKCTIWNPKDRPSMGEIIAVLKEAILESDQSKGESHSDLSIADLHFLQSESTYDAHMGSFKEKSLSDLSEYAYDAHMGSGIIRNSLPVLSLSLAELSHPSPVEYSCPPPLYGMKSVAQQPAIISVAHHPHTNATSLENQGTVRSHPKEIVPAPEEYHPPPNLSDYGYHYAVQSPNEHPPFPPPNKGDSLPAAELSHPSPVEYSCPPPRYGMKSVAQPAIISVAHHPHTNATSLENQAELSHPSPVEYSCPPPPYGMKSDVQQPAIISVAHHPHTNATSLENQGADYNEQRLSNRVLELEKEVEGKRILVLFGEGYEFEKEMLIQLWMALELLTDEEIGADYFEKLVSGGYICFVAYSLYKVNTEKLMFELDMIKNKLNYVRLDNGSRNDAASAETLHASVVCDEIDASIFKILGGFNKLRTLIFLGNYGSRLEQVPRDLFLHYGSLAALDLSGTHIKELPSSAGKMINLRYLDLSWTLIEVLPERIDRFAKLQTLKLEGCSCLRRLPKEMKGLTELRHLHLDVLRQLAAFPEGMGALVNIRTLSAFPCGTEEGRKISQLKYLNNITGKFCIAKMENVQSTDEAKEASLTAKRNIKNLKLKWSNYPLQEPRNEDESILKNLCPHSDLEEIHILCYPGSSFPDWVADVSFHKLVSITLFRCVHVAVLPSLEKLPSLESLELISLNSVTKLDCKGEVDHVAFPKLQKLAIDELLNVQTWTEAREGDYPSLVELSIKDCPKLPELPSLLYLPSIKHLEVSGCSQLAFLSEKELSPSLQQFIVEDCPLIEERCSKKGGQDWYKIQHVPTIWIDQVAIQTHEDI